MKKIFVGIMLVAAGAGDAFAEDAQELVTAWSLYSKTMNIDNTVLFNPYGAGKKLPIRWGFDTAWNSETNMTRGVRFATPSTIACARVSFQPWAEITQKGVLPTSLQRNLDSRMKTVGLIGKQVEIMLNLDGGDRTVKSVYGGYDYVNPDDPWHSDKTYVGDVVAQGRKWADLIDATMAAVQKKGYEVVTIAPLNEPDLEVNGTPRQLFYEIARNLKDFTQYPRFKDVRISGGNTLNDDVAWEWYEYNREFLDEGNTHQLAGNFNNYADFFAKVREDGKYATADELHNVMEAMVGVEYGMQTGIWWGTAEQARGEFMKASFGERLGYGENRDAWSAASVYRMPDGKIRAFLGCSERQAKPSTFKFVSFGGDVFIDGHGPVREYTVTLPGDDRGVYQSENQKNAETMLNIETGDDPRPVLNGNYVLVNKYSGWVIGGRNGSTSNQTRLEQQSYSGASHQQWNVKPVSYNTGGDFSYFWISNANDGQRMDNTNYSLKAGQQMIYYAPGTGANQQWALEYDGDGWFHIRNKESALYLQCVSTRNISLTQEERSDNDTQKWRFIPVGEPVEFDKPHAPAGLTADARSASVLLEWEAVADAGEVTYTLLRADNDADRYNVVARGLQTRRFLDNTVTCRDYSYKVLAVDASGNRSEASECVNVSISPAKSEIAYFPLESDLLDVSENKFSMWTSLTPGYSQGALNFSAGQFGQLPYTILDSEEFTVTMMAIRTSKPLFSTGYGKDNCLTLSLADGGVVTLTGVKDGAKDVITGPELERDVPVSVAITVAGGEASLYIGGEPVGTGLRGFIPDYRTLTYIGRSQDVKTGTGGSVSKVRVFNRALDPAEIKNYAATDSSDVPVIGAENEVVDVEYYSIQGFRMEKPSEKGVTIVRKRFADGTVLVNKITR